MSESARKTVAAEGEAPRTQHDSDAPAGEKRFHVWRLLGVIGVVVAILGLMSFMVDWLVIGPLRGRLY